MKSIWDNKYHRSKLHRVTAGILAGICLLTSVGLSSKVTIYAQTDFGLEEYETMKDSYSTVIGYREYLEGIENVRPDDIYVIEASDYVRTEGMTVKEYEDYRAMASEAINAKRLSIDELKYLFKNVR